MKTSEKLLAKLREQFPQISALKESDVYLISNKAYLRFGNCFNWCSSNRPSVFSYHTMTECVRAKNLEISEYYSHHEFQGYLIEII